MTQGRCSDASALFFPLSDSSQVHLNGKTSMFFVGQKKYLTKFGDKTRLLLSLSRYLPGASCSTKNPPNDYAITHKQNKHTTRV
ncbi:unknown [Prevotella sp. CAG:873]|nr:unknown [Prevotella sp. CAG:873]